MTTISPTQRKPIGLATLRSVGINSRRPLPSASQRMTCPPRHVAKSISFSYDITPDMPIWDHLKHYAQDDCFPVTMVLTVIPKLSKGLSILNKTNTSTFGCVEKNPGPTRRGKANNKKPKNQVAKLVKEVNHVESTVAKMKSQARTMGGAQHITTRERPSLERFSPQEKALAQNFINSVCVPDPEQTAMRWASVFSGMSKTAVASPWSRAPVGWSPNEGSDLMLAYMFRNPLRHAIVYDYNTSGSLYEYELMGRSVSATGLPLPVSDVFRFDSELPIIITDPPTTTSHAGTKLRIQPGFARSLETYSPHGSILFAGTLNGDPETARFLWLEAGTTVRCQCTYAESSTAIGRFVFDTIVGREVFQGALYSPQIICEDSTTVVLSTIERSAYYNISFEVLSGFFDAVGTVVDKGIFSAQITFYSEGSVFCHLPIRGMVENISSATQVRVIGQSMMYSNNAAPLVQQGKCVAVQLPVATDWTTFQTYESISGAKGSTELPAKNGLYVSSRPTHPTDLDYKGFYTTHLSFLSDSFYPIVPDSGVVALAVTITATDGRDAVWTFCNSLEYETSDVWRSTDYPMMKSELASAALDIVKTVPQVVENPLHLPKLLRKIGAGIGKAYNFAEKYGPYAKMAMDVASHFV